MGCRSWFQPIGDSELGRNRRGANSANVKRSASRAKLFRRRFWPVRLLKVRQGHRGELNSAGGCDALAYRCQVSHLASCTRTLFGKAATGLQELRRLNETPAVEACLCKDRIHSLNGFVNSKLRPVFQLLVKLL